MLAKSVLKSLAADAAEAALRQFRPELFPGRLDASLQFDQRRRYDRMSQPEAVASVYFVACGDFIKIGVAESVLDRLCQMQTGNPFPLRLLGSFTSARPFEDEERLHEMFRECHHRGEWFKLTEAELLARLRVW